MDKLKQLFWILFFSVCGEIISHILSNFLVIPGSVIGMLLLFFALHYKLIAINKVEEIGNWLTDNMAFLFVPAGVGLMSQFHQLGGNVWWQLLLLVVITTALMMWGVGHLVQWFIHRSSSKDATVEKGESL